MASGKTFARSVMGVEDMFEGLKWDPQFDDVAGGWTGDNRAKS